MKRHAGRVFADRAEAGAALAVRVARYLHDLPDPGTPLVLALPRGGVPVAAEVAAATGGELDIVVARKIGAPGRPEFGVGALAEDGPPVFDETTLRYLGLGEDDLAATVQRERAEARRRMRRYRGDRPAPRVTGRTTVLVDDGLATGVTARAALRWLHQRKARRSVLAVPVSSREAELALQADADAVLCLQTPHGFTAVGEWYTNFREVTDDDVVRVLARARP